MLIKDIEKIRNIIKELISIQQDAIFLVEGKKDVSSLTYLGIDNKHIITLSNEPISSIAYLCLSSKKQIIDFIDEDAEGKEIQKRIKAKKVYMNSKYKLELFNILNIFKTEEIKKKLKKEKIL